MSWVKKNLDIINKLKSKNVDIGISEQVVKHNLERNITLESELTACEVLLNSFDPNNNSIHVLSKDDDAEKIDIKINDEYLFQVKRIVYPEVQSIIMGMHNLYFEEMTGKDSFSQAIISFNPQTGMDFYKNGYPRITKTKGIMGAEILIELDMFNEMISQKILKTYDNIKNKNKIIPIIDVRYFEIPSYQYLKDKIHKYYSDQGYFLLFLTYKYPENNKRIPIFSPIYYPETKYSEIIDILNASISYNVIKATHSYFYLRKGKYDKGWNDSLQRDEEGYIIINEQRICKSLAYKMNIAFFGLTSEKKLIEKVSFNINGEIEEYKAEYLKNPRKKK